MPLPSLCSSVDLVIVAHQPPHPLWLGEARGPSVADAKAFLHRMCFFLLFNVSTYFCVFFLNSSSGSCYLIPFYNISLKLPNAFLKQGSKGIQNHREGCSLGLFLSRLCWVPQGPRPSSLSTQPTH